MQLKYRITSFPLLVKVQVSQREWTNTYKGLACPWFMKLDGILNGDTLEWWNLSML